MNSRKIGALRRVFATAPLLQVLALSAACQSKEIPPAAVTYKEEEGRRAFQDGQLLFHRQWPYQYAQANATDGSSKVAGKFDVAPLPGKDGPGVSTLGGHNFGVLLPWWDVLFGTANFEKRFDATGVRDQVEQGRDYGRGFWSQQWLGIKRLFGKA